MQEVYMPDVFVVRGYDKTTNKYAHLRGPFVHFSDATEHLIKVLSMHRRGVLKTDDNEDYSRFDIYRTDDQAVLMTMNG